MIRAPDVVVEFLENLPPQQIPQESGWLPWLAVLGAWACFGSFAVPMKSQSVVDAQVHPIIFQTYKTFWTFASSSLVLLFWPFEFTWWGIVSGFSWVPAGVAAVIAVQNVGIACGQAIWQVTIIGTSFVWGFMVLQDERVYNWWGTALALVGLTAGVLGMTMAFNLNVEESKQGGSCDVQDTTPLVRQRRSAPNPLTCGGAGDRLLAYESLPRRMTSVVHGWAPAVHRRASKSDIRFFAADITAVHCTPSGAKGAGGSATGEEELPFNKAAPKVSYAIGVMAAVFNGVWGGANLVPSHFSSIQGVHYVLSFGIGAVVANVVLLISFLLWQKSAGEDLPRLEFRVMMVPGFLSGVLWSLGNFCSLYAVASLGQGIGYSLVQASIIISGLWGILYYHEMTGHGILYWALACVICGLGVVGLALESAPPL